MIKFKPPINDRRPRFALVGCGRIAANHFSAFEQLRDRAELVAVCDIDPTALAAATKRTGSRGYASLTDLLAHGDSDIVVLATPSGLHPEQTIQIAESGRHVMTEKPMATRWEDGKRMVQACDNAGVRLFVVKQNRLNPSIQLLKRAVDKGRFGRIYLANTTVRWNRPQEYYDAAPWRGTWEFDGGAFMNQASHYVDLIQWLVGPVESVVAKTATQARKIEAEDSGVAVLRFRNGALGVIEVNVLTHPRNWEGSVTIIGERGTAKVGGTAVNRIDHWAFAEYDDDDKLVESVATSPPSVYGFGHEGYYRNVLAVLRGEAQPETDGRAGRKSLELILGIYESAKTGRDVPLPLRSAL
jgi:UDP-N-acetyl-2-amino-2-deoxyglucuronate dehydrogenase